MKFIHSDLGHCQRGDSAEITLTRGANVRLLDSTNFSRYRRGQSHRYIGGLAKRSPVRLSIPTSGRWHVAVDMQGLRGSTSAGIRRIPASSVSPLPALRPPRPEIADIASALAEATDDDSREFDVFISHASEDKDEIVRPLATALAARGCRSGTTSSSSASATRSAARSTPASLEAASESSSCPQSSSPRAGPSTNSTGSSPWPCPAGRSSCRYGTA